MKFEISTASCFSFVLSPVSLGACAPFTQRMVRFPQAASHS